MTTTAHGSAERGPIAPGRLVFTGGAGVPGRPGEPAPGRDRGAAGSRPGRRAIA